MKVLLINPPNEGRVPSCFPLGIGYIASALLKAGHDVEVLDIFAHQYSNEKVLKMIPTLEYDYVGITAMSTQYHYVKWLSKELKRYHSETIILGGALSTFSSEIVLNNTDVDVCIIGEGEQTIIDILKKKDLDKVKGIHYKRRLIIKNEPREYIKDLDSIPFPAWHLFPMQIYLKTPTTQEGYAHNSMNIVSARGCPYNCNFCSKTLHGVRIRSVENIIAEIKELIKLYDVKVIDFTEELVMISKPRMYELCKQIAPLKIKWSCQGRVNNADYDLLKTMKKAGCFEVGYGIESGSQTILNNMNKSATVEMNINAVLAARKAGIRPSLQTMYGYVGENEQTIKETIEYFKTIHSHPDGVSMTTPLPGSPLYEEVKKKGMIKDEEQYLDNLKKTGQFTINLTEMSDEKLLQLKEWSDKEMYNNYYKYRRRHPIIFIKDYSYKVKRLVRYIRLNGVIKTTKDVYQTLMKKPELIFQGE